MLLPIRRLTFTSTDGTILQYDYICEQEIDKSYMNLTDKVKITIPRKLVYKSGDALTPQNQGSQLDYVQPTATGNTQNITYVGGANATTNAVFKRGMQVKIEIGYYPNLTTRFEGYISKVISKLPLEIDCEDKMWILKQSNVVFPDPKTWEVKVKNKSTHIAGTVSLTLKQFLTGILGFVSQKIEFKTVDDSMNLGRIVVNDVNAARALEILKERFGLFSYFRNDGILYVGFANNAQTTNVHNIVMDANDGVVIDAENMQWTNANDVPIKVKGVSTNFSNKTITYEAGQDGGDVYTQYTFNQDAVGLKLFVDNLLPTFTYNGWRGDFLTLGEPVIEHGDIIKLTSKRLPERNGSYLVKAVKLLDGKGGFFQRVTIGIALQNQ